MRQDLVVTKANSLIEASYRLSVSEQRAIALLAAQVQPQDEDFKPYRFHVADLAALMDGNNKRLHSQVKALTRELVSRVLTIHEPDGALHVAWLSSAKYYDGEGTVELCFDPKLKPYMLKLKSRFTSYKLANVIKLRSRYSVRFYELLKEHESLGGRTFALDELRKTLGIPDAEYPAWKDFRVRVLDVAKRELPKKTDISFSYKTRKRSRAVHWVDFKIFAAKSKTLTNAQIKGLRVDAAKCWAGCHGNCRSTWEAYQNKASEACHWCKKLEASRLEGEGQLRLVD